MLARHAASRPAALVRQHVARTVAAKSNGLGRRNISRLSQSSSRISTVFGVLLAVGITTTSYGLCVHLPPLLEDNVPTLLSDPTTMLREDTNSTLPSPFGQRRSGVTCVLG